MKKETNYEKMIAGKLYLSFDDELGKINRKARDLLDQIDKTSHSDFETRNQLVKKLFGSSGENLSVNKNIYVDYGVHIHVGNNFYANYGLTILDICEVRIGDNAFLAPNVHLYTAYHPIDAAIRNTGLEIGAPITIGNNVWIGGNATINPGVTIGDNVVVASGAVVTKSFGDNVIIGGNPAKVLRAISEKDKLYWEDLKADYLKTIKR